MVEGTFNAWSLRLECTTGARPLLRSRTKMMTTTPHSTHRECRCVKLYPKSISNFLFSGIRIIIRQANL
jgi:hypothetical protein